MNICQGLRRIPSIICMCVCMCVSVFVRGGCGGGGGVLKYLDICGWCLIHIYQGLCSLRESMGFRKVLRYQILVWYHLYSTYRVHAQGVQGVGEYTLK